jgi:hypothetical protein
MTMRELTVKYQGECKRCGATLDVGAQAMYEKSTGIFCMGHEPTDSEEIRAFRQEKADRKAERYEMWADKRREKASAQLNSYPEIRHDIALCTQPGHIPFRARMNRADDRAYESLGVARRMEEKAENIRNVRVAGDAERRREARREAIRQVLKVGDITHNAMWGIGIVRKINEKTATIEYGRAYLPGGKMKQNVCLSWLTIIKPQESETGAPGQS